MSYLCVQFYKYNSLDMLKNYAQIISFLFLAISVSAQITLIDFEIADDGYTPSDIEGSGFTDVFNRSNSDLTNTTNEDGFFWAVEDINLIDPTITLDQIDITGAASFDFSIDLVSHHYNDWDDTDEILITYSLDGGAYNNLLWIQSISNPGDAFNEPAAIDTDFDGAGDCGANTTLSALSTGTGSTGCVVSSSDFKTFSASTIALTGNSTLDIKIQFNGFSSTDEGIYLDNIKITENSGTVPPSVQFTSTTYSLAEDGMSVEVCADVTNPDMSAATTIDVALDVASTATNGTDYDNGGGAAMAFPVTLTFPANAMGGDAQQCFDIFISTDDSDIEGDETIIMNLTNPSGTATIGTNSSTTVTIVDNDFAPTYDVIINEIMADPTGHDCNLDGTADSSQDEFVEFYNNEAVAIDIGGYTVSDGFGVRYTFDANTMIPAGEFFTIFGGGDTDHIPGITFTSTLGLNNSGDDIILADGSGNTVVSYTYGSEAGDDQSIGRFVDFTGPFEKHSIGNTGVNFTPNRLNSTSYATNLDCTSATVLATNSPNSLTGETFGHSLTSTISCAGNNPGVWYDVNTDDDGGDFTITVTPSVDADVAVEIFDACSGNSMGCVDANATGMIETLTISDPAFVGKGGSSSRSDVSYKVLVSLVTGITSSTFDIEAAGTALPVELTSITATTRGKNVLIEWKTASELNNDRFEIERSIDGKSYETIGAVKGEGSSTKEVDYSFNDKRPVFGVNYYRLKQVDIDGKYDYSDVVLAEVKSDKIIISPSRTQDVFRVHLPNESAATIKVYNISGQLMLVRDNVSETQEIHIGNFVNGTYFVAITANNLTQVEKVVKL